MSTITQNTPLDSTVAPGWVKRPVDRMREFTVVGYWDNSDSAVTVATIEGSHYVGGGEGATAVWVGGVWSINVRAGDVDSAERAAVTEVERGTGQGGTARVIGETQDKPVREFTVVGYYNDDDDAIAVGVIEGRHTVGGGPAIELVWDRGAWDTHTRATDMASAEAAAVAEMSASAVMGAPDWGDDE